MIAPRLSRPLLAAAALAACGLPAGAQITGSLPQGHPMKDGSGGAFGATGSFSGGLGGFGRTGFGRTGFGRTGFGTGLGGFGFNRGIYGGGFFPGVYGVGYPVGVGGYYLNGLGPYGYGVGFTPTPYGAAVAQYGPFVGVSPGLGGATFGPPGTGVGTLGPVLNPGYGPGFGYGTPGYGYGGYGYGSVTPGVGPVAPAVAGVGVNPAFGNPVIGEALREEADRWRAPIDLGDAGPLPAAPRPAGERELADALKEERAGDLAFGELDFRKALAHYRRAAEAAPTRGEPLYRAAFARIALGQFAAAGEDLRRALNLNPSLPVSGPTLAELFGPRHTIARTAALGGVAELARGDVRDADRLFLLGATMHANGDDRAREIFEAAWRLTGGRPHLRPYLDPVTVEFGPARDAVIEEAPADPADPAPLSAPAPQLGGPEPDGIEPALGVDLPPDVVNDAAADRPLR